MHSQNSLLDSIEEGSPSDNSLLLLSSFFGSKLLTQALELADAVVKVSCQASGRSFFRIQGTDASPYLVICSFCTCRAFEGHALAGNRALLCKHSLAAVLADKWKVPCARCSFFMLSPPVFLWQRCALVSVAAEDWCKQVGDSLLS